MGKGALSKSSATSARAAANEHLSIMRADQGGVFDTKDGKVHVLLASIPRMHYIKAVKKLLKYLRSTDTGYFVVDGCLWVGAARISGT